VLLQDIGSRCARRLGCEPCAGRGGALGRARGARRACGRGGAWRSSAATQFLRFAEPPLAAKDATLADCVASGAEMRAACDALAALAASDAPFAYGLARTAADLCAASRRDCEKFPRIAECAAQAAAAGACEAACRKAAG